MNRESFNTRSALVNQISRFSRDQLGDCARNAMLNALFALDAFNPEEEGLLNLLEGALDAGVDAQDSEEDYAALARYEASLNQARGESPVLPQQRRSAQLWEVSECAHQGESAEPSADAHLKNAGLFAPVAGIAQEVYYPLSPNPEWKHGSVISHSKARGVRGSGGGLLVHRDRIDHCPT